MGGGGGGRIDSRWLYIGGAGRSQSSVDLYNTNIFLVAAIKYKVHFLIKFTSYLFRIILEATFYNIGNYLVII